MSLRTTFRLCGEFFMPLDAKFKYTLFIYFSYRYSPNYSNIGSDFAYIKYL